MLIEFTAGNYRSFKEKKTLRMDAASSVSEHRGNLISVGKHKLLRSAVLYGANASGKSNLLRAMGVMKDSVLFSVSRSSSDKINVIPFKLDQISPQKPCYFEVVFIINEVRYRYGFEIDKDQIHSEWLFESKKEQEKPLFIREMNDIQLGKNFLEGKGLEKRTKSNTLFLSVCDQFNGEISKIISKWFAVWEIENPLSNEIFRFKNLEANILEFIKMHDLGIDDIFIEEDYINRIVAAKTRHTVFDGDGKAFSEVEFDMVEDESSGTNKLFDLSIHFFSSLQNGSLFIADELDAKLHPLMTRAIVRLFNEPATNPNNAQLIFATHDTNLLSNGNFRRDQIYFTEKDQYGATDLYSLAEFKEEGNGKVRKDRSFYKDYMQGRYGAVPHIGNLENLLNPTWQKNEAEVNQ